MKEELDPVIERSLEHYSHYLIRRDGYTILDPKLLEEPSSIAHSAFMLLSLIHSRLSDRKEKALLLADGILVQQRPDGSHKIYFGHERDDTLWLGNILNREGTKFGTRVKWSKDDVLTLLWGQPPRGP